MPDQPLSDVSVLELTTMVAGPYAGQILGDLGADVVKVEKPDDGELAREIEPTVGEESFYYLTVNRNKRSLALDVTTDEGRELFLELAEECDVILENFHPAFTDRYGIGYESVRERNESIVYCSISAFGGTGPYREHPGIDTTVQALTGAMSMTRGEGTPPMRSGVPMNDVFAALHAVVAILVSLYDRRHDDEGEFIDVSLFDAGIAGLTTRGTYSLVTDEPYPPFGRHHNYFAPEGVFELADGPVQLSVVTDRHWRRFCEAIDAPELAADERFETNHLRVNHRDELNAEIQAHLEDWPVADLVETLRDANVPGAPINDTRSVWEDPQVRAREMHRTIDHPRSGTVDTLGFPVKYANADPEIRRHPPILGEHSAAVVSELGYSETEIERLLEEGILDGDRLARD